MKTMKNAGLLPRFTALLLTLALALPSPAHALRATEIAEQQSAGLEELQGRLLGGQLSAAAGLEETQAAHRFNMSASTDWDAMAGIIRETARRLSGIRQSPLLSSGSTLALESNEDKDGDIDLYVRDRDPARSGAGREILLSEAIDNAIDAIRERAEEERGDVAGEISVHAGRAEDGRWYLEVRDNGMGILRDRLETLFHQTGSLKRKWVGGERERAGGAGRAIAAEMNYGDLLMADYEGVIQVETRRPGEEGSRLLTYDPRDKASSVRAGERAEPGTTVRWVFGVDPIVDPQSSAAGLEEGGVFWADAEDFVRRNPEQAARLPEGTSHLLVLRGDSSIHLYRPGTLAVDMEKVVEDGLRELAEGGADLQAKIHQESVPMGAEMLETPGFFVWDDMMGDLPYPVELPHLTHSKGERFPFGLRQILTIAIFNSLDAPSVRLLSAWTYEEDGVPVFVLAVQA